MKPVKPVKPVNVSRNTPLRSARRRALAALTRGAVLPGLLFLPPLVAQADYATHPAAQPFIDEMVTEHGFERAQLEAWLGAAQRSNRSWTRSRAPQKRPSPGTSTGRYS
jgi:membrane-bound lytic murein transglycosylase B